MTFVKTFPSYADAFDWCSGRDVWASGTTIEADDTCTLVFDGKDAERAKAEEAKESAR